MATVSAVHATTKITSVGVVFLMCSNTTKILQILQVCSTDFSELYYKKSAYTRYYWVLKFFRDQMR